MAQRVSQIKQVKPITIRIQSAKINFDGGQYWLFTDPTHPDILITAETRESFTSWFSDMILQVFPDLGLEDSVRIFAVRRPDVPGAPTAAEMTEMGFDLADDDTDDTEEDLDDDDDDDAAVYPVLPEFPDRGA